MHSIATLRRRGRAGIFDLVHVRKGPLDSTKLDPEIRLAFARRIAEISGKTVEQVLVESEVLGRQGRVLF